MRALDLLSWIAAAALVLGATSAAPLPQAPTLSPPLPAMRDQRPPHGLKTPSLPGTANHGIMSRFKSLGHGIMSRLKPLNSRLKPRLKPLAHRLRQFESVVAQFAHSQFENRVGQFDNGQFEDRVARHNNPKANPWMLHNINMAGAFAGDGLWQVAVDHRNPFNGKPLPVAPPHSDDLSGWPIGD
ncbi:MAG: hypothetical protein M1826_006951 [Phylliscum demangeonii]|nr:MAG: hypothetical protein M1826_006951 [Phylliscum demangeonii]